MSTENTTVLLVEDHKNLAEAVGNYLESCGINVDFAYDGLSGMHLATTNLYDAIILDIASGVSWTAPSIRFMTWSSIPVL